MTISAPKSLKIITIAGTRLNPVSPQAKYIAIQTESIPAAVRWFFVLFVSMIPFEAAQTNIMAGSLSLAKISGLLFTLTYFFYYNPFRQTRSLPPIPSVMWWFLGYLAIYTLNGFFISGEDLAGFITGFLTLVQLIVFFWIASSVLEDDKTAKNVIVAYTIASAILALGILLQLPGFSMMEDKKLGGRMTGLEQNPNTIGALAALATIGLIGLRLTATFTSSMGTLLLLLTGPLLLLMVKTGSRAAVGAFAVGCAVYLVLRQSERKLWTIVLASLAIIGLIYVAATDPISVERWQQAYYEGNMSGRTSIYSAAIEMFLERPLFGWYPVEFWYELGFRLGRRGEMDAHNLFLHLLLEVGLVGAIPFVIGLWRCFRAAWKATAGNLGLLPLALLVTTLLINMAGTGLRQKPFWLFLALAWGTGIGSTGAQQRERLLTMLRTVGFSQKSKRRASLT